MRVRPLHQRTRLEKEKKATDKRKLTECACLWVCAIDRVPTVHGSYAALVSDPNVDIIYVATPDAFHAPHALLALRGGKHVLVEKPFTLDVASAEEVVAEARKRGLMCMEGQWMRFVPGVAQALEDVARGRLGTVQQVQSDFGCRFDIPAGALNALGVYSLAFSQMVYNADRQASSVKKLAEESKDGSLATGTAEEVVVVPTKLQAIGSMGPRGSDVQVGVQMSYGEGQLSQCSASLLVNGPNEATIVGTAGHIRIKGPLWHSASIRDLTNSDGQCTTAPLDESEQPLSAFPRPFHLLNSQRLIHEAVEFNRCVRARLIESPAWTHAQTLQVMKMMEQVREQIRA